MHPFICRLVFAAASCWPALQVAGAERPPDHILWSYRTPFNETAIADGATGGFSFPNESSTSALGDVVIGLTKVYSWSVASASQPDVVNDLPFRFSVEVRDESSAETALLSFEGTLSGRFWRTGSALTADFTGDGVRSVELSGREYEFTVTDFDAPTGYGVDGAGSIRASVRILDVDDAPVDQPEEVSGGQLQTPEPTTLALVGTGLSVAAWIGHVGRRRRSTADTPVSMPERTGEAPA